MAASTNPFASALEGHKEQEGQQQDQDQQHQTASTIQNPHNPFVHSTPVETSSQPQPSNTTAAATNPFAQSSSFGNGYTLPQSTSAAPEPVNEYRSANTFTDELSGLDFGTTAAATVNPTKAQTQPEQGISSEQFSKSTSLSSAAPEQPSFVEASPTQQQPSMAATTYAPPPGPPPGIFETSTAGGTYSGQDNYTTQQQQYQQTPAPSAAHVSQADADEAYARQLLAEDEERIRQRREQRRQDRGENGFRSTGASDHRTAAQPSFGGGAIPTLAAPLLQSSNNANEEKQWNTKEVYWQGRVQRIIIQNENGPCSLIALCNVLLLRGTLQLTPEDRPAVSYSYLSSLLGEHLIDVISTSGSDSAMDLEAALSILPQTQTGLDVNVCFDSIYNFSVDQTTEHSSAPVDLLGGQSSSSAITPAMPNMEVQKQKGELALFKLCNVPLVHGWLADKDDKETWAAVVERAGDYDKALDRVVAGDQFAKGTVVEGGQGSSSGAAFTADGLEPHESEVVHDAILIRNFLEDTATQLTYPGLYTLSTQLERGTTYAFFRNSHLSVLYRPTEAELQQAVNRSSEPTDAAQPQLYQLVTDSTLESEDTIVWESVEDVDGSASRFYDGKFRQSKVQDFVGRRDASRGGGQVDEDADFAYAQQLQDQESHRARRVQQQQQRLQRPPRGFSNNGASSQSNNNGGGGGGGNVISRMLAARKSGKRAPSSNAARMEADVIDSVGQPTQAARPTYSMAPLPTSDGPAPGQEYEPKKDKWYKKIF